MAEGLHAASGLPVSIKWPNDLVIAPAGTVRGARKLGGILAEGRTDGGALTHVIVGFGVNVRSSAFPPEISARATSLEDELGRDGGSRRGAGRDAPQVLHVACAPARGAFRRCRGAMVGARRGRPRGRRWSGTPMARNGAASPPGSTATGALLDPRRGVDRARHGRRGDLAVTPDDYCRESRRTLTRKNDGHLIRIVGPGFRAACAGGPSSGDSAARSRARDRPLLRALLRERAAPAARAHRFLRGRRPRRVRCMAARRRRHGNAVQREPRTAPAGKPGDPSRTCHGEADRAPRGRCASTAHRTAGRRRPRAGSC